MKNPLKVAGRVLARLKRFDWGLGGILAAILLVIVSFVGSVAYAVVGSNSDHCGHDEATRVIEHARRTVQGELYTFNDEQPLEKPLQAVDTALQEQVKRSLDMIGDYYELESRDPEVVAARLQQDNDALAKQLRNLVDVSAKAHAWAIDGEGDGLQTRLAAIAQLHGAPQVTSFQLKHDPVAKWFYLSSMSILGLAVIAMMLKVYV